MSLADLIRGRSSTAFATATLATPATQTAIGSNNSNSSRSNLAGARETIGTAPRASVARVATVAVATARPHETQSTVPQDRKPRTRAGERCAHVLATLRSVGVALRVRADGGLCWPENLTPELRRLIIDYRQDLTTEIQARELDPNAREFFEERASIAEFDGDADRDHAEASGIGAATALMRGRLPAHVAESLQRVLVTLGVPERDYPDYRRDLVEHIAREGVVSAMNWLRSRSADADSELGV